MKLSWLKLVRVVLGAALPALLFYAKLGFGLDSELVWISTFDSESFELELNGSAWDTFGSSFVQIP